MQVRLISQQSSVLWQNRKLRFRHCIDQNKAGLDQNKDNSQEVASDKWWKESADRCSKKRLRAEATSGRRHTLTGPLHLLIDIKTAKWMEAP